MRLRSAICCTLLGITLISIGVVSLVLQSASAQSIPDFSFPGITGSPSVRSQLWINNGAWWGIFSDESSGLYFHKKVGNDFIKGSLVDANAAAMPDTLWDGTHLYVLVHAEEGVAANLYKYSYSAGTDQYDLTPGFPVTLPLAGLPISAVIAKDSNQKLWVAYAGGETGAGGDSSVHVIWSTSPDHLTWDTTGLVLETGTASAATEVATIVAFNDGAPKIGVFWSNQTLGEYAFKYHSDADVETTWSAKEVVDSNGSVGIAGIAGEYASIQAAPDGRIFAVGNDEIGLGHVHLYVRSTSGAWSPRVVVNTNPTSQPSRPIVLLDIENNFVYCLYRDSGFNKTIHYTRANLSNPTTFEPQRAFISTKSSDPTSTKQHLNSATDLILATSDTGLIFWNILNLSNPPSVSFTATPTFGPAPLAVNFTDTSTDDDGIVSHLWNFGDGYTSTEANPTHVFRAGTWNVTLQVTDGGGGSATSAGQSIVVSDVGAPVLQAISPAAVNSNTVVGDFTITVDGAGFASGAVVRFNGSDRLTSFVDATRLTATLTLADVAAAGAFPITVALPSSAVSNAMNLTVVTDIPEPTISTISPTTIAQGSPAFTLTVNGTNFVTSSKIWVNGTERVTTFVSPTQLTTDITADLAFGLYQIPVWVVNPAPGGGTSNTLTFDITPVCPTPAPSIAFAGRTTFNTIYSQLWYNDTKWWAAISDNVNGIYFWSHTNGQFVKGPRIDTNRSAAVDTLWNGTHLLVLTYHSTTLGKFYKYSYDSVGGTYTLVSGFPVNITLTGAASSLTFSQDSTGKLWATYTGTNSGTGDGNLHIIWTTTPDHLTWDTTGAVLESGLSLQQVETSAITTFGGNKIGVTWTNQATNELGFIYHIDGDPENTWSVREVVNSGVGQAAAFLSLKGLPDGRVFLAHQDTVSNGHINLFRRNASETWDPKIPVTRNPVSVPTSPIVLFDSTNSEVYVLYREAVTTAVMHAAHMNIGSSFMPASCPIGLTGIATPTGTKQTLNATMDLAVAARRSSSENLIILDLPSPPAPTVFAISPDFVTAGQPDFILTVDGTNFSPSSVVRFNGINRATTYVSNTQLTAQITAADVDAGGLYPITVASSGELESNSLMLAVDNLAPTLTSISPTALPAGNPAFELTAIGTNFNSGSILRFNGVDHVVTAVSSTEIRAQIAASEISSPGVFPVEVSNPSPGGGVSGSMSFAVQVTAPTLTSIAPTTATAGGAAFALTVNGADFNPGSVVLWNGVNRVTSFVSSGQLTAQITALDIQSGAVFPVSVSNPGGSSSSVLNFTVNNPLPQITTITPATAGVGGSSFTLTVNGSGFVPGSVVRFNGDLPANDRTTAFVSGTQLTATISAADIATPGAFSIKVFNPTPIGGLSNAVNLSVSNPSPTITSISPTSVGAGAPGLTLTVNGSNFNNSSVVRINAVDRATTFLSNTQLSVQINAAEVATPGSLSVAVFNPAPGGGLTSPVQLPINNPLPAIVGISPSISTAGTAAFTLTVNGTNFISGSVVRFNNSDRVTTFVSATQLQAQITAADIAATGTANISVFNPAPGGGTSSPTTLAINNAVPTIGSLSPTTATAGGSALTLTVNGTGFINGSVVRFNNADRATAFVSSTQLTIQITASDIATAGTASISVFTPAPGGGASSAANLPINNLTPTLTSISPATRAVGDAAFALLASGSNFNSSSVVRFNGSDRPTTFVNASQLSAQISAADVSAGGAYPIVVFNPSPGGGSSSAINLNVSHPVPAITNLAPSTLLQGGPAFELTVNGTGFGNNSVVAWNGQNRSTIFMNSTQLKAQITADDLNAGPAVNVTVINPAPGGGTSNAAVFTITPNPRLLKVVNASGSPGSAATLTIQLVAQGDENALGFSLYYDTSLLSNPTAAIGADGGSATLNVNTSQAAQGHLGLALSLPSGTSFTAGTKNLIVVTFTAANVGTSTQTAITFGDQPIGREVANSSAEVLATAFIPGTLAISTGLEGDVAPRPNGSNNGTVSVADWVQVGRFAAGVDTIGPGLEFQKADCAPRNTLGNGSVTVSDWVQAGRYAAGVDPPSSAGGPTGPSTGAPTPEKVLGLQANSIGEAISISRAVRMSHALHQADRDSTISIELEAQGTENALGFSLMFDPETYRFSSAESGLDAQSAILHVNQTSAAKGRIGIAIALPSGQSFRAGTNQVVVLRFVGRKTSDEQIALTFTDLPINRELVAIDASNLKATFDGLPASEVNPIDDPQFFVYQHYLDILGRSPDGQGLDYWTDQITSCGLDQTCRQARRVDVSDAFFTEPEFQHTGAYIHRVYKSAFGTNVTYAQFMADRGRVVGSPRELERSKREFTNTFVQRSDFTMLYPLTMSPEKYVDALIENAGNSLTQVQRDELVKGLANGTETRGSVLRKVAENEAFVDREYNSSFVLTQYYGYLRRDPEVEGFDFWLGQMNRFPLRDITIQRAMICSFISSAEYRSRFGPAMTDYHCGR
jgi:PKD repeat protein